ncbi:neuronal acetylcholine receptor subunit alpha-5-like [Convolutriloba macropyga]|uniref:neuronal acetylcholine receptor subunit alpha-5-like n=1 Tax=Convolutriloba macropyga TaxID=536237 RepID=UPI003F51B279
MSLFERSEIVTERMIIVVKVWVYLAVFTNHVKSEQVFQSEENLLQRSLIEGYNRRARPVKSFASTVNMTFGASLYQLVEFNAKAETMTTLIWQRLQWKDEMLSWNPDDYDGIDVLRYSITDLWVPDILPYNEVGIFDPSKYHKVIPLWVEYDGSVHWTSPLTMTTTCTMDVTNFPFDSQTCMISLGSWQYTADQVDIYCSEDSFDLASYAQHTQWELQSEN